jgi:hypothetical protein
MTGPVMINCSNEDPFNRLSCARMSDDVVRRKGAEAGTSVGPKDVRFHQGRMAQAS